jgi:hypothetical protein
MLFDALHPILTWKRIFASVQEEMQGDVDDDKVNRLLVSVVSGS